MLIEADSTDHKSVPKVLKKDIIPNDWKSDIDQRLVDDLLYANRYFGSSNPNMAKQVAYEAKSPPVYFYQHLVERWDWHHSFFEKLLEPALPSIVESDHFSVSPHQLRALREAYYATSLVDLTTLPMTVAIKSHLNIWIEKLSRTMSEEERGLLLTPPRATFFAEYAQDHIRYILYSREDPAKAKQLKEKLLKKYHADDEIIFSGRIEKFRNYSEQSDEQLIQIIGQLDINHDYKIRHFYSTLERPQLKAVRDTLIYDNYEEYMILMGLIGISGHVLRKRVLQYLNDSKILPNDGSIYEFPDQQIVDGLSRLEEYRKEVLHKNVKPYIQTGLTCGAASLLMAFDYYGILEANRDNENLINSRSNSSFIDGNHFAGLAMQASERGLEALLIHSYPEMFMNNGIMPDSLFQSLMTEYNDYLRVAVASGTKVKNGQEVSMRSIRELMEQDYLVIIAGQKRQYLHALLGVGYNQDGIIVRDPLDGRTYVKNKTELEKFMNSLIGNWVLAIRRDQASLEKLRVEIPRYTGYSKNYLNSERG